jgi:hypothetical protein
LSGPCDEVGAASTGFVAFASLANTVRSTTRSSHVLVLAHGARRR